MMSEETENPLVAERDSSLYSFRESSIPNHPSFSMTSFLRSPVTVAEEERQLPFRPVVEEGDKRAAPHSPSSPSGSPLATSPSSPQPVTAPIPAGSPPNKTADSTQKTETATEKEHLTVIGPGGNTSTRALGAIVALAKTNNLYYFVGQQWNRPVSVLWWSFFFAFVYTIIPMSNYWIYCFVKNQWWGVLTLITYIEIQLINIPDLTDTTYIAMYIFGFCVAPIGHFVQWETNLTNSFAFTSLSVLFSFLAVFIVSGIDCFLHPFANVDLKSDRDECTNKRQVSNGSRFDSVGDETRSLLGSSDEDLLSASYSPMFLAACLSTLTESSACEAVRKDTEVLRQHEHNKMMTLREREESLEHERASLAEEAERHSLLTAADHVERAHTHTTVALPQSLTPPALSSSLRQQRPSLLQSQRPIEHSGKPVRISTVSFALPSRGTGASFPGSRVTSTDSSQSDRSGQSSVCEVELSPSISAPSPIALRLQREHLSALEDDDSEGDSHTKKRHVKSESSAQSHSHKDMHRLQSEISGVDSYDSSSQASVDVSQKSSLTFTSISLNNSIQRNSLFFRRSTTPHSSRTWSSLFCYFCLGGFVFDIDNYWFLPRYWQNNYFELYNTLFKKCDRRVLWFWTSFFNFFYSVYYAFLIYFTEFFRSLHNQDSPDTTASTTDDADTLPTSADSRMILHVELFILFIIGNTVLRMTLKSVGMFLDKQKRTSISMYFLSEVMSLFFYYTFYRVLFESIHSLLEFAMFQFLHIASEWCLYVGRCTPAYYTFTERHLRAWVPEKWLPQPRLSHRSWQVFITLDFGIRCSVLTVTGYGMILLLTTVQFLPWLDNHNDLKQSRADYTFTMILIVLAVVIELLNAYAMVYFYFRGQKLDVVAQVRQCFSLPHFALLAIMIGSNLFVNPVFAFSTNIPQP